MARTFDWFPMAGYCPTDGHFPQHIINEKKAQDGLMKRKTERNIPRIECSTVVQQINGGLPGLDSELFKLIQVGNRTTQGDYANTLHGGARDQTEWYSRTFHG
uniref:Uncharacterized protein n=1 Tax=Cacopsylla melanoneura TaxID=428564 RepID=A0A8D8SKX3_9HEMI